MCRSFRWCAPALLWLALSGSGIADETPSKAALQAAAVEPFAKVKAEWDSVDSQLSQLVEQFREAPPEQREAMRTKYLELVNRANSVLARLRASTVAEYKSTGNENKDVVRTMLGLLNDDLRNDQYVAASALARLLIDGQCPEPVVFAMAGRAAFGVNDFEAAEKFYQQAAEAKALDPMAEAMLSDLPGLKKAWDEERAVRAKEQADDDLPRVKITTNKGVIMVELFENQAPQAVANFISLVEQKFYDGLTFHRVLGGFMAQGGCPTGDGTGGPGYKIYCECDRPDYRHHFTGTLSMAHAGKNTGGSQFFLTFLPTPHLDGRHTAFGRVIEGLEILPKLQRRDPQRNRGEADKIITAEVVRKRDHKYEPTKVKE